MPNVTLNGEDRSIAEGQTVALLLADLSKDPRTVAIELNGSILPRGEFETRILLQKDRLEIVEFVQGGSES